MADGYERLSGTEPGVQPELSVDDRVFAAETGLITSFVNGVRCYMRESGITDASLAERMGVQPGRLTQILSGGENPSLRTLAEVAVGLSAGMEVVIGETTGPVAPQGEYSGSSE